MDIKDLTREEKEWEEKKPLLEREYKLEQDKQAFKDTHPKRKKISTSKLLVAFLFINCTIIEIFTGWVTVKEFDLAATVATAPDLTPLVTLIGAVVSEVIGFAVYAAKSAKENTQGGIVYERTMAELNQAQTNQSSI